MPPAKELADPKDAQDEAQGAAALFVISIFPVFTAKEFIEDEAKDGNLKDAEPLVLISGNARVLVIAPGVFAAQIRVLKDIIRYAFPVFRREGGQGRDRLADVGI